MATEDIVKVSSPKAVIHVTMKLSGTSGEDTVAPSTIAKSVPGERIGGTWDDEGDVRG